MDLNHSLEENFEIYFRHREKDVRARPSRGWGAQDFFSFRRDNLPRCHRRINGPLPVMWRYLKTRPRHFIKLLKAIR